MDKSLKHFWLFCIAILYGCSTQVNTEKTYRLKQLEGVATIDTIKDYSFDKKKLLPIDSLLKIKWSKKIKFDDFSNDYELIPLKPKLKRNAILLYSIIGNSTKLITLNDEMDIIDSYDVTYYGAHKIEDDGIESNDKFSIFKSDSIITIDYTIDEFEGNADTVSSSKEVFLILEDGRIVKK